MANPHKGEVSVVADGKAYTLIFSANAMCEVEDLLGRPWLDIATEIDGWVPKPEIDAEGKPRALTPEQVLAAGRKVRTVLLRALIWGALREHHEEMSLKDAGRLMEALPEETGGALGLIGSLFTRAMPEPPKGNEANPPQPDSQQPGPAGTGPAS